MIKTLFEDNHLLALDKPYGVPVQPDASQDPCLLEQARRYVKEKYAKPGRVFLALAHRLDRPVSGVLLLARTGKAAGRLAALFRERKAAKLYHAVVHPLDGFGDFPAGTMIELINGFIPGNNGQASRIRPRDEPGVRNAALECLVLGHGCAAGRRATLLEVRPRTGYKHQIRAQLAWAGMPVAGDFRYGPHGQPARPTPLAGGRAIALHATRLEILHPVTGLPVCLDAPWPGIFAAMASCGMPAAGMPDSLERRPWPLSTN